MMQTMLRGAGMDKQKDKTQDSSTTDHCRSLKSDLCHLCFCIHDCSTLTAYGCNFRTFLWDLSDKQPIWSLKLDRFIVNSDFGGNRLFPSFHTFPETESYNLMMPLIALVKVKLGQTCPKLCCTMILPSLSDSQVTCSMLVKRNSFWNNWG